METTADSRCIWQLTEQLTISKSKRPAPFATAQLGTKARTRMSRSPAHTQPTCPHFTGMLTNPALRGSCHSSSGAAAALAALTPLQLATVRAQNIAAALTVLSCAALPD